MRQAVADAGLTNNGTNERISVIDARLHYDRLPALEPILMLKPTLLCRSASAVLLFLALSLIGSVSPAGAQVVDQALLSPADGWEFGNALASSGSTLVVGDQNWFRSPGHTTVGAVYVFTLNNGQWTQQARLTAADGKAGDLFGCSVAISGNTIVVGAMLHSGRGAAYVFTLSSGQWTQQQELTASDGKSGDSFGCCVGVYNTTIAVGCVSPGRRVGGRGLYLQLRRQELDPTG